MLKIKSCSKENTGYLKLVGEMDISTIEIFQACMKKFKKGAEQVVLDFNELHFMDSTGIRSLVQELQGLIEEGISVKIQNIPLGLYELMDLIGITEAELVGDNINSSVH